MNNIDSKHYFDWAATAPFDTKILEESLNTSILNWGNPSSIYKIGTQSKSILNEARELISQQLKVDSKSLYFTSGGTESDHIPLLSILNRPEKGTILVSSIEHPALREQCNVLSRLGYNVLKINPDNNGIISPETVSSMITDDTLFITIMAVNNETGAIQPIEQIAKAIEEKTKGKRKPKFHVDYVQALGKIPIDLKSSNVDSAAFSAHKIGGPRGIGLLYIKDPKTIDPFLRGGGQEQNIRSGTENVFGAIAFSKCIEKYNITNSNEQMTNRYEQQKKYINDFIKKLSSIEKFNLIPTARLDEKFSDENYSPWVIQCAFDKIPGQVMVRALDSKGFYISTGSACSSRKNSRPILEAMNVKSEIRENAVRFSFGPSTTKEALDELFIAIKEVCNIFK